MYTSDIQAVSSAASNKAELCNKHPDKFIVRSAMAGFYIVVATLLSNVTAAVLYPTAPAAGKILSSLLFSIAIILIVFIGGELFTGNNMTMTIGLLDHSCSIKDLLKVWIVSYIGNFAGAFILSSIAVASGASRQILTEYFESFIYAKLSIPSSELLLRGIMCNFLVCLAVWTGTRMKSESGKLIVMFLVIMSFVISGFEHCIANMSTFTIAYLLVDGISLSLILKSMFFVTIGNIIGGALLLAIPLKYMSGDK